jgi:hypothetical protein
MGIFLARLATRRGEAAASEGTEAEPKPNRALCETGKQRSFEAGELPSQEDKRATLGQADRIVVPFNTVYCVISLVIALGGQSTPVEGLV